MRGRHARVRVEFADWYPGISPGKWHDATWVREVVLAQQRRGSPRWVIDGRILNDLHFEFQGASPRSPHRPERMVGADISRLPAG